MKRSLLALSAATVLCAALPASAAATYSLREPPGVGSMIPEAVITSPVPFDKTYAQLSAEQKATLAQDYESLAAGDEPPFPAQGLHPLTDSLLRFVHMVKPVGPLVAAVDVGPDGQARKVTVFRSPDPDLTRLVTTLMIDQPYKPALCHGSPCAMQYVLRLDFPERNELHIGPLVPTNVMNMPASH